jgi:hypothetical protein
MTGLHVALGILLIVLSIPLGLMLAPLALGAFIVSAGLWRLNQALQPWTPAGTGAA